MINIGPGLPAVYSYSSPGRGNQIFAGAGEGQCGHVVRPAGARGCHAAQRRAGAGRAEGDGSPPDGQTDADGQAGRKL